MIDKITKLGISDVKSIMKFDKLCFPTDFWNEGDWVSLLEDETAVYYSILDNKQILACVFIYNWYPEKDFVKVTNIAVHPNYRKQGLAHKLLNHVTQEMRKNGAKRFCSETRSSNISMQKVFDDCGYKLNVTQENYYKNPEESAFKYILQL